MKVFGKNVFNELKDNIKSIKKVYRAKNFNDKEIIKFIQDNKISYSVTDPKNMDGMVEGRHQGIIAVIDDYEYVDYRDMLNDNVVVMLDHLEDPHNFGAILRSCEAMGVDGVIVPKRGACPLNSTVAKTSTGAIELVKVAEVNNLTNAIKTLKENGYWIVGAEAHNSVDYRSVDYNDKIVLVVGSEGKGISRLVIENCDYKVKLPMKGKVNSLNVSVACAVLLYQVYNNRFPL